MVGILMACEKEKDDTVRISAELPETIQMGIPDTLIFTIASDANLNMIYVEEEDKNYLTLDWRAIGKSTRYFKLNLIYNPQFAGKKNMELRASDGRYTATFPFTLYVIE